MARIVNEEILNDVNGLCVCVDADNYEEARAMAYERWEARKAEMLREMIEETANEMNRAEPTRNERTRNEPSFEDLLREYGIRTV